MAFYQLFHLILHEIDRFGCFKLKSGFFSKSLVLCLKPIRPRRFCRKTRFEASRVVFWSLSCYKELKLTTNRFTGPTLRGLLYLHWRKTSDWSTRDHVTLPNSKWRQYLHRLFIPVERRLIAA